MDPIYQTIKDLREQVEQLELQIKQLRYIISGMEPINPPMTIIRNSDDVIFKRNDFGRYVHSDSPEGNSWSYSSLMVDRLGNFRHGDDPGN